MASNLYEASQLYEVLTKETEAYRQLIRLTDQERQALREDNRANLETITYAKEKLQGQLNHWLQTRELIVANLIEELQLPAIHSLFDLFEYFEESTVQKLMELFQELISLVKQLLVLNRGNQLLLKVEVDRLHATFGYLALATVPIEKNYTVNGSNHHQRSTTTGYMLNKEI